MLLRLVKQYAGIHFLKVEVWRKRCPEKKVDDQSWATENIGHAVKAICTQTVR